VRVIRIETVPAGWSPKKQAITRAISESAGEVILTTDADCRPEPGWIAGMVGTLTREGADLVAGYSPYGGRGTVTARLLALETLSQGFLAMAGIGIGRPITCQGRSFGYRRNVFEALGGFGPPRAMLSGDDHLFLQRAVARGYRAVYCDATDARVWTDPPATWKEFVHQRIRMFSGARQLKASVAVLGAGVYTWLLAIFLGMLALYPVAWGAFLGKMLLDAVSLVIAAARVHEWRLLRVYPLAACLYLPYFLVFAFLGTFGSYRWKGSKGR
jgi:cellulose synthase/poly-beta-1,6-N-acetylglucosamine synthase-like glycosyltransferase